MNPTVVIWILAAVVCVFVGREIGKWLFGKNEKLVAKKRAALSPRHQAAGRRPEAAARPARRLLPWAT